MLGVVLHSCSLRAGTLRQEDRKVRASLSAPAWDPVSKNRGELERWLSDRLLSALAEGPGLIPRGSIRWRVWVQGPHALCPLKLPHTVQITSRRRTRIYMIGILRTYV